MTHVVCRQLFMSHLMQMNQNDTLGLLCDELQGEIESFFFIFFYRLITDHVSQLKCEIDVNRPFTVFNVSVYKKLCHFQTTTLILATACASSSTHSPELFSFMFNSNSAIAEKTSKAASCCTDYSPHIFSVRVENCFSLEIARIFKMHAKRYQQLRVRSKPFVGGILTSDKDMSMKKKVMLNRANEPSAQRSS